MVDFVQETGLHDWLNIYGIGNHGGGPTRTEIDYYRTMQEWPIYPQVIFSTAIRLLPSGRGARLRRFRVQDRIPGARLTS